MQTKSELASKLGYGQLMEYSTATEDVYDHCVAIWGFGAEMTLKRNNGSSVESLLEHFSSNPF